MKYGRLILIGRPYRKPESKEIYSIAICDCGTQKEYRLRSIKAGHTLSCGCYSKEVTRDRMTIHGLYKHPLYRNWDAIIQRCSNPKHDSYKNYGGRGITVCPEWRNNFQAFYNYAIANGWKDGLETDRFPNHDGNYEPGNCRFVTTKENLRNKKSNKLNLIKANVIRNTFKIGAFTKAELAGIYCVTPTTINDVIINKTWA